MTIKYNVGDYFYYGHNSEYVLVITNVNVDQDRIYFDYWLKNPDGCYLFIEQQDMPYFHKSYFDSYARSCTDEALIILLNLAR